jgi:hypothetical protein
MDPHTSLKAFIELDKMRALIVLFIFQSILAFILATCPKGMVQSLSNPTICYSFQSTKKAFFNAEEACIKLKGHLASVHNLYTNIFIAEQAQEYFVKSNTTDFWLGANDLQTLGKWRWTDSTSFKFSNWNANEPKNSSGNECAAVQMNGGSWITTNCFHEKPYVCLIETMASTTTRATRTSTSMPTTAAPEMTTSGTCPDTWVSYNQSCYKVLKSISWQNAENECVSQGAHLASIHNSDENDFVRHLAPLTVCSVYSWNGLHFNRTTSTWQWSDNTPLDYTAWAPGRPIDPFTYGCGIFWNGPACGSPVDSWGNAICSAVLNFGVCKM